MFDRKQINLLEKRLMEQERKIKEQERKAKKENELLQAMIDKQKEIIGIMKNREDTLTSMIHQQQIIIDSQDGIIKFLKKENEELKK